MSRSGITTLKDNIAAIEAELAAVNYETVAVTHPCWSRRKELADKYLELADAYEPPQSEEDSREIVEAYFKSHMINYNGKARKGLGLDRWSTTKSSSESILLNADISETKAKFYCGLQYLYGIGKERSSSHAFAYIKAAADDDCVEAKYYLGCLYRSGIGVAQDAGKAGEWNQKAANQGYAPAQFERGHWCAYPYPTSARDEAIEWCRKAANQGDARALELLGTVYEWGRGVTTYKLKAVELYQKAVSQGYAPAQRKLGDMYKYGSGVKASDAMAIMWHRKAASQERVGELYVAMEDDGIWLLAREKRALDDYDGWKELEKFFNGQGKKALQIEGIQQKIQEWKGRNDIDAVKNELVALLFGIENKQERFDRMLQAICKSTGIGMILAEPAGIIGKSNIAKGRLGELAAALNTLAEDDTLEVNNDVKGLLKTQMQLDPSFVPNLETQYKKLHKKLNALILEVNKNPVKEIAGGYITHWRSLISSQSVISSEEKNNPITEIVSGDITLRLFAIGKEPIVTEITSREIISPQDDRYGSPDSFYPLF